MAPTDKNAPKKGQVKNNNANNQTEDQSPPLENQLGTGKYDGVKGPSKTVPEPSRSKTAVKKDELTDSSDEAAIESKD